MCLNYLKCNLKCGGPAYVLFYNALSCGLGLGLPKKLHMKYQWNIHTAYYIVIEIIKH